MLAEITTFGSGVVTGALLLHFYHAKATALAKKELAEFKLEIYKAKQAGIAAITNTVSKL